MGKILDAHAAQAWTTDSLAGGVVSNRSSDTTASRLKSTSAVEIVEFGCVTPPGGDRYVGSVGPSAPNERR